MSEPCSTELLRDAMDLAKEEARYHYQKGNQEPGDLFHSLARRINEELNDEWETVGYDRYVRRNSTEGDK